MNLIKFNKSNQDRIGFSAFVLFGLYIILYNPILTITETGLLKPVVIIGAYYLSIRMLLNAKNGGGLWYFFDKFASYKISIVPVILFIYFSLTLTIGQVFALFGGSDEYYDQLWRTFVSTLLPLACLMILFTPKYCNPVKSIIVMTAIIGTLQSIFIILDATFPAARVIFSNVVIQPNNLNDSFRAAGLTSITGDGLSFSQAICGLCAFFMLVRSSSNSQRLLWSLSFTLIFISMIPVARTGIVILLFFSGFIVVFSKSNFYIKLHSLLFLFLFNLVVLTLLYFFVLTIDPERLAFFVDTLLPYAFEFVFQYFEGDGFTTASTEDIINNMVIYPGNLISWVFGDGYYSNPTDIRQNYMGTDIGYLRILFYVGLLGSFLIYSWYLMLAYCCYRREIFIKYRVLFFAIFGSIMVANLKFPFVLQNTPICFAMLLLLSTHRDRVCGQCSKEYV